MAGIYEPVKGHITVQGRVSPLFDIGLGVDGDLTGYDNIRLRGQLLGLTAAEIETRLREIGDFTELGDFLNMPARVYSAGMMLRLMFAVATSFAPDILLMDEWIVAGDARFIARAEERISTFIRHSSIVVLATHQLELAQKWCNQALWLDHGQVKALGAIEHVIDEYNGSVSSGLT
jgi:ABC-type polysaccharide/polyol phosphate transport system ATPase subunit